MYRHCWRSLSAWNDGFFYFKSAIVSQLVMSYSEKETAILVRATNCLPADLLLNHHQALCVCEPSSICVCLPPSSGKVPATYTENKGRCTPVPSQQDTTQKSRACPHNKARYYSKSYLNKNFNMA